jgi:hypothetical protein
MYALDLRKPVFPVLLTGQPWPLFGITQYEDMTAGLNAALSARLARALAGHVPANHAPSVPPPLPGEPITGTFARPTLSPRRAWWVIALVAALLVVAALLIIGALNGDGNGGDQDAKPTATTEQAALINTPGQTVTPTPEPTDTPIPTETPTLTTTPTATDTLIPVETQVLLDITATQEALNALATAAQWTYTPSHTPTPTDTATPTPDYTQTYDAAFRAAMQTLTATVWTPTPTMTYPPSRTPTPTVTFTPSPIPAGASNDAWTPIEQTFDGIPMVYVPAGCLMMGSEDGSDDEQPVHEVCLDAFWIDKTEVTNAQYGSSGQWSGDNRPRENVTWVEARDFCESRGARLPTEAEWEYAARGPEAWEYPWGNTFVAENVVYSDNSGGQTADVGSRPGGASWVGALDMSGNVWEWVSSLYQTYPYSGADGRESNSDTSSFRVLRGGSFSDDGNLTRAANRPGITPTSMNNYIGFRCARSAAD